MSDSAVTVSILVLAICGLAAIAIICETIIELKNKHK